jgi:hypothetical protein
MALLSGNLFAQSYCPIYPYAFHGSYVSYYALQHPGCGNPGSIDGPHGLSSDCNSGQGCFGGSYSLISPGEPALDETSIARRTIYTALTANMLNQEDEAKKDKPRYANRLQGRLDAPKETKLAPGSKLEKETNVKFEVNGSLYYAKLLKIHVKPKDYKLDKDAKEEMKADFEKKKDVMAKAPEATFFIGWQYSPAAEEKAEEAKAVVWVANGVYKVTAADDEVYYVQMTFTR